MIHEHLQDHQVSFIRMGFLYDISGTLVNFYNGNIAEVIEFEHIQWRDIVSTACNENMQNGQLGG